jgi:hypothetical protein
VWRGSPAAHSAFLPQRFLPQPSFGRIYHKTLVCCRFARISTRIELRDSGHLYRWIPDGGCDSQTFSRSWHFLNLRTPSRSGPYPAIRFGAAAILRNTEIMLRHAGNDQWFPITSAGPPQTADPAPWPSQTRSHLERAHDQWPRYSEPIHEEAYSYAANSIRHLPHPFAGGQFRPTMHQQLPGPCDVAPMTEPTIPPTLLQPAMAAVVSQIAPTDTSRRRQARPKSEKKSASKWEQHKTIMADLYMKENMSLEVLRRYMRDNLGFDAS